MLPNKSACKCKCLHANARLHNNVWKETINGKNIIKRLNCKTLQLHSSGFLRCNSELVFKDQATKLSSTSISPQIHVCMEWSLNVLRGDISD